MPDPQAITGRSDRAVVHYATRGRDALSRQAQSDSDANGIPDYVECVEAAASAALEAYERWGFKKPRADRSGGDPRPDIYLVRDPGDAYGKVLRDGRGDVFVLLSTRLEPLEPATYLTAERPRNVFQGVWFTAAHELFHVVQSAYLPTDAIPPWIKEATANTWMMLAAANVSQELVNQVDGWLKESHLPMSGRHGACDRCYGSLLFWLDFQFPPGFQSLGRIPVPGPTATMFELLAARYAAGRPIGLGTWAAEQAFKRWYPTLYPRGGLFPWFIDLMYAVAGPVRGARTAWPDYPEPLRPADAKRKTVTLALKPMSAARVAIPVSKTQTRRSLEVTIGRVRDVYAFLDIGGRDGVRQELGARTTVWRVDPTGSGNACRLQGSPVQLKLSQWADVTTAKPDAPHVDCLPGVVDLVLANSSSTARRSVRVSYRALPVPVEVPGVDRSGDAPVGAPDLETIEFAPTPTRLTWLVRASKATLSSAYVRIYIDADSDPHTGGEGGIEYYYDYNGPSRSFAVYALRQGAWVVIASGSVTIQEGEPFPLELWISPQAIADPLSLRFKMRAWNTGTDLASTWDDAPSTGSWPATTWKGYWTR